jgi:hypothetical protein
LGIAIPQGELYVKNQDADKEVLDKQAVTVELEKQASNAAEKTSLNTSEKPAGDDQQLRQVTQLERPTTTHQGRLTMAHGAHQLAKMSKKRWRVRIFSS